MTIDGGAEEAGSPGVNQNSPAPEAAVDLPEGRNTMTFLSGAMDEDDLASMSS